VRGRSSGDAVLSVLALLLAMPISVGIAVFISEFRLVRLQQPLVFLTELLAAIPSIVYGLWGSSCPCRLFDTRGGDPGSVAERRSSAGRRSASACSRQRSFSR
jgi:ABC-type phosphate transport system permease subunit